MCTTGAALASICLYFNALAISYKKTLIVTLMLELMFGDRAQRRPNGNLLVNFYPDLW